jgi:hypothetical protein
LAARKNERSRDMIGKFIVAFLSRKELEPEKVDKNELD